MATRKIKRDQFVNVLNGRTATSLFDELVRLRDRLALLETEFNNRAVSTSPPAALAHEVSDVTNMIENYAPPVDLATAIIWANIIKTNYALHLLSLKAAQGAHQAQDVTNLITAADATDQASLDTLLDDIKAQFVAHFADIGVSHAAADASNVPTAGPADATLATAILMIDDLVASFNGHILLSDGIAPVAAASDVYDSVLED